MPNIEGMGVNLLFLPPDMLQKIVKCKLQLIYNEPTLHSDEQMKEKHGNSVENSQPSLTYQVEICII